MDLFKILTNKKYLLIFGLVFMVILLAILTIRDKNQPPSVTLPSPSPLPSPSIMPTVPPKADPKYYEEINDLFLKRHPLAPYLPFENEDFAIDYIGPLKLVVELKTATQSAKQETLDWIQQQGVDPQSHEIIFK